MKALFIMVLSLALTGCLSNESTYKQADNSEITEYEKLLNSGKSILIGDVYYEEKYCRISEIHLVRDGGEKYYKIVNQDKLHRSLDIFSRKDKIVVPPGSYRVAALDCHKSYVSLGGGDKSVSKAINDVRELLQPKFDVEAGQILHIGTLKIKTIKKATYFDDARVLVAREPTTEQAKAAAKAAFGQLGDRVIFTN